MIENPFDSIESAQEYLGLLGEALKEARDTIQEDTEGHALVGAENMARRRQALHLVGYKLDQLRQHVAASRRILNDLRTLRRLLLAERGSERPAEEYSVEPQRPDHRVV